MIHVIATVELQPGKRDEYLPHFHWVQPLVQSEAGCIEYAAAIDTPTTIRSQLPPRPDVVVVVEKWESLDALYAHLKASHMDEYRNRVATLVKSVSLQVLQPA